jgi:TPR repeat protein
LAKTVRDFQQLSWSKAAMNQSTISALLGVAILLPLLFAGCSKSGPANAVASDELATLRQEVAALREEVQALRNETRAGKLEATSANSAFDKLPSTPAEMQDQFRAMRAQLDASRRELGSNLVQITVDRGGDAWKRGDFKEALKLLSPQAEAGNAIAQHRLGVMYVFGQGVPKDSAEAIKWFTKSAEQGQGESQHSLGLRNLWGDGVEKNPEAAAAWFQAAANQGISDSATWLGDIYWNGNGVKQDVVEGYKWLLLAGDKFGINHRNMTLEQFGSQLTPAQKAEAEQRARDFVPRRTGPEDF